MRDPAGAREPRAHDKLPEWHGRDPADVWPRFFRENRPAPAAVQRVVLQMHDEKEPAHVVSAIQSALINGQSQPWMYEVLALSMEITGAPKEDVERVVLSLSDFGGADFASMLYSAAYLVRLERYEAALRMYRQAGRIAPDRAESYLLALPHARRARSAEAVQWAAAGILRTAWAHDHQQRHREAENAALEAEQWLRAAGDAAGADALQAAIAAARRRDLVLRLTWSGKGDLDLIVEEPAGTVCSFENRDSPGGGVLVHDGYGPDPRDCYEEYVASLAMAGEYRLLIRHAWGEVVGRRALLTVIRDAGGPDESVATRSIVLDGAEAMVQLVLPDGRRTHLKDVAATTGDLREQFDPRRLAAAVRNPRLGGARGTSRRDFEDSRSRPIQRAGAIGFQPIVTVIPEGNSLSAAAVVSADRRYVRLGVFPLFSDITDVFTFSFVSGAGGVIGGGGGGGGGTVP